MRKKKNYLRLSSLLIAVILMPVFAYAAHLHPEKAYQQAWCDSNYGVTEVVLPGGSRVDCLTETHAVEVEFAEKWQEAVGQALYYGKKTGRDPGILLIKETPGDQKYLGRLLSTVRANYPFIRIWVITPESLRPIASPASRE